MYGCVCRGGCWTRDCKPAACAICVLTQPNIRCPPASLLHQQAAAVESGEAVTQALLGLPLPADVPEDAMHQAAMLRMLGSLQDIR